MKKLLLFIFLFQMKAAFAQGPDTVKVLFVGNSFTAVNDLPLLFEQLAIGANKPVVVAAHMPGGISVGDISQGAAAHMNNPLVYNLIRSNDWDFLVLQDNQGRFCLGYGIFPSTSIVIEGHIKIRDSLLYYHPCAKMLWFAGWGPKAGYPPYAYSGTALMDSIYRNYTYLRDTAQQVIAPIGPAWKRIVMNYPALNLWDTDDVHPGLSGSSLTADVIYTSIFKSSPMQSTFRPAGISSATDSLLKSTAAQTVFDSLNYTGLQSITPQIQQNGNVLSINSTYNSCAWYFNDTLIQSGSTILTVNQNGNYFVQSYNSSSCGFRSQIFTVTNLVSSPEIIDIKQEYMLYPNPCEGKFKLSVDSGVEKIQVFSVYGKDLITIEAPEKTNWIDVSTLQKGIYLVKLFYSSSKIISEKICFR